MAIVGLTVNYNAKEIQNKLVEDNIKTTRMVELTARIERRLYQSLVYLSAIKETQESQVGSLTLDAPNQEMLAKNYYEEIGLIHQNLFVLENLFFSDLQNNKENNIQLFRERFEFYEKMSTDWLLFRKEDPIGSSMMFNTSISPYFRNNIIPIISALRELAVSTQLTRNKILSERLNRANQEVLVMSVVFIFISIGIGYYLYLHIVNPLRILTVSAQRLGVGQLEGRLNVTRKDELGQLAQTFNTMASNLKKRTMARDYLDNIIESIQETLVVTDEQDIIVGLNKAATKLLGFVKEELIGKHIVFLYKDTDYNTPQAKEKAGKEMFEFELCAKNGELIPVLFSQSSLINANKEMVGKVYVATDISAQKKANERIRKSLQEKDVLLAEIHHRVKNNLAVVAGILQLQSYATKNEDVITALKESETRIKSISLVHEMMYQSESVSHIQYNKYVEDLITAIEGMQLQGSKKVKVNLMVTPFLLDANKAIPCSLLLNEIIMNSFEYSMDGSDERLIAVDIKLVGDNVEMCIYDGATHHHNVGSDFVSSLEHTLIETLTTQLEGAYRIDRKEDGTRQIFVKFGIN